MLQAQGGHSGGFSSRLSVFLKFWISPFEAVTPAGHFAGRRHCFFCWKPFVIPFMFFENFILSLRRAYPCGALRGPEALLFLLGAFCYPFYVF